MMKGWKDSDWKDSDYHRVGLLFASNDTAQERAARPASYWQYKLAQQDRRERRIEAAKKVAFWALVVLACCGVWALIALALATLG